MAGNLTIGALLTRGIDRLRTAGAGLDGADPTSHTLDAEVILAHALSVTRTQLRTHPERVPNVADAHRYAELIERRAAGEPIAYLLGYRDFWTLRLTVNPGVLVPRPETELLVERALALGPSGQARIVDLGTGSGAIALALASERPDWSIVATDLSEQALGIARGQCSDAGLGAGRVPRGAMVQPPCRQDIRPYRQQPTLCCGR